MQQSALDLLREHCQEGIKAREEFFRAKSEDLVSAGLLMAQGLAAKRKLLICGNGGSAADAQHVAAEFVNRFLMDRPPLPALALTTDSSALTAIGNDFDFNQIFAKQITALGETGDVLLAISTSGSSPNILEAVKAARGREMKVIGLTGRDGGKMADMCDILLNVEHDSTPVIQEVHLAIEHMLCRLCDYYLFENVRELIPHMIFERI